MASQGAGEPSGFVVEGATRLSESLLYELQDTFYESQGIAAFASGEVPHLLTGSPMLARAYSGIVKGFVADVAAGKFGSHGPDQPLYVIELGAGPGRLGYHMLRQLQASDTGDRPHVVYVLTDVAERNVNFHRNHPRLRPFIESGHLDFARVNASHLSEIHLEISGKTLRRAGLVNPPVVIANYVLDVLPQDLYAVLDDRVVEELIVCVSSQPGMTPESRGFLDQLYLATRRQEMSGPRYRDNELDKLLKEATSRSGGPRRLLFPVGALRVMRALWSLSNGRFLLLVGERPGEVPAEVLRSSLDLIPLGPSEEGGIIEAHRPGALLAMGVHGGTFSMPVDHSMLAAFVKHRGGSELHSASSPVGLSVTAYLAGENVPASMTRERFNRLVDDASPEDVFLTLQALIDRSSGTLPLPNVLALIRLASYDPYLFHRVYGSLEVSVREAEADAVEEAVKVLERVYEADYAIDAVTDLAYGIAMLLAAAKRYEDALRYLEFSTRDYGDSAERSFNMALCHLHLGNVEAGLHSLREALEVDPGFVAAQELREAVMKEHSAAST